MILFIMVYAKMLTLSLAFLVLSHFGIKFVSHFIKENDLHGFYFNWAYKMKSNPNDFIIIITCAFVACTLALIGSLFYQVYLAISLI